MAIKRMLRVIICKYCGKVFYTRTNKKYCCLECRNLASLESAKSTLCWKCVKARADSDCSWANDFIPVEGWLAEETRVSSYTTKGYEKKYNSYIVKRCPKFEKG